MKSNNLVKTKKCNCCKKALSLDNFREHKTTKDGYDSWCKDCVRIAVREYQRKNRKTHTANTWRYILKYPERQNARQKVRRAVRSGKLVRLACFCGEKDTHAHHPDWSKPLEVIWLCPPHHKQEHKKKK